MKTTCLLLLLSLGQLCGFANRPVAGPETPNGLAAVSGPLRNATLAAPNLPPVAPTIQPITIKQAEQISVQLPAFTDPDGDPTRYSINALTLPPGLVFNPANRTLSGKPTTAGYFKMNYFGTTWGNSTHSVSTLVSLIITPNRPPVAPVLPAIVVKKDATISIQLPAFTDAENDVLSARLSCSSCSHSDLPDGLLFNESTRTLSGKPAEVGEFKFMYSAIANGPNNGTDAQFFLVVTRLNATPNLPPVAPVIQPISLKQANQISVQLPAFTDPDGDPIAYSVNELTLPPGLTFNPANRSLMGKPTSAGLFRLDYRGATWGNSSHSITTRIAIIITPNTAPVPPFLPARVVKEGQPFRFQLPSFTDPDNDPITHSLICDCYGISGSHSDLPNWMQYNAGTRTLSGTAPNAVMNFPLLYSASDNTGENGTNAYFTFVIEPNTAPTAPAVADKTLEYGESYSVTLPEFTDPDGDPIQNRRLRCNDCQGQSGELPFWMTFDANTRKLSVNALDYGGFVLYYLADDNKGHTGMTPVRLTVREYKKPALPTVPNLTVKINESFTIQLPPLSMRITGKLRPLN